MKVHEEPEAQSKRTGWASLALVPPVHGLPVRPHLAALAEFVSQIVSGAHCRGPKQAAR
jgi:hypothetical protein